MAQRVHLAHLIAAMSMMLPSIACITWHWVANDALCCVPQIACMHAEVHCNGTH
jgi:hypothetical protein